MLLRSIERRLVELASWDLEEPPIYMAWGRGRRIPLLKTLLSSCCKNSCYYCAIRRERRVARGGWSSERLVRVTLELWKRGVIKGFFRYAVRTGIVNNNPAASIMGPKLLRPLPETLTIKQVIKIIETPDRQTLLGRRDRALLEFLYGTGSRISEALGCRMDDLIRELQLVRLYGKGKKERVVPLGRAGWAAIDEYLNRSRVELANHKSADFLFLGKRGDPLKRMAGWRIVKKYCRLAGVHKKISPHTFRHSFASHLLIGGADLLTVQELLGHADISTTEIYTHLDRDFLIAEYREYHPREKWN